MDFFIVPCITFTLGGVLIGYISPKYDWAVQTLLMLGLATIISFVLSFIFSDIWYYTLMFACISIPGIITSVIADRSNKKEVTKRSIQQMPEINNVLTDNQKYYIGDRVIGLTPRKGYEKFPIAGTYYQNLPMTVVGKFNGYAELEPDNEYDKLAIAVYNDEKVHLGYLPKGNKKLYSYIGDNGGRVHAYGYIGCHDDGGMYGEVCVETDKGLVVRRNKPYAVN